MPSRFLKMPGGDVYRYSEQLAEGIRVQEVSDKEALDYFVSAGGYDLKALGFSDEEIAAATGAASAASESKPRAKGKGKAKAKPVAPEPEPAADDTVEASDFDVSGEPDFFDE
jgi:hypothetical protein